MRKRKNRERIKRILKRSTPKSSILNELATNYKDYYYRSYLKLWHRHNFFTQTFLPFKHSGKVQKSIPTAQNYSICVSNRSSMPGKCNFADKQHYVAEKKLLLSGDIELNPGPVQNENTQARITLPSYLLLEQRLGQFQMRPLDVGGAGDCFFRAVSHQLYGDPSHDLDIRDAGIAYMRENPERFIESNTDYSWDQYLNTMSIQGTWCDGLIIQAVADQLNLKIVIVESNEHFAEFNIIQAITPLQRPTNIYLGHIDEYHYVSTLPCSTMPNLVENQSTENFSTNKLPDQNIKNSRNAYMKEYEKSKQLTKDPKNKQKSNEYIYE